MHISNHGSVCSEQVESNFSVLRKTTFKLSIECRKVLQSPIAINGDEMCQSYDTTKFSRSLKYLTTQCSHINNLLKSFMHHTFFKIKNFRKNHICNQCKGTFSLLERRTYVQYKPDERLMLPSVVTSDVVWRTSFGIE